MRQPSEVEAVDPRGAVRPAAWLSMILLLAAAISGLFASGGGAGSVVHGVIVTLALPVAFLGHLIALVACREPTSPQRQEGQTPGSRMSAS